MSNSNRAAWTAHIEGLSKPGDRTLALGRLKSGVMNKTEARYGNHLELRKQAGEILWYGFEKVTFKLADDTRYTPDFLVLRSDFQLQVKEVKGTTTKTSKAGAKSKAPYFRDDAKPRIKIAAEMIPMAFFVVYEVAGQWVEEEI